MTGSQICFDVEGESLDATILSPDKLVPGILFIHGWGGSRDQDMVRAEEIAQRLAPPVRAEDAFVGEDQ